MVEVPRPAVLCVDDEPHVLDGLTRHLRRKFTVTAAVGAPAGLAAIGKSGPFAVVVSDMRMPEMDGAAFLKRVREIAPDTVRVLLTGHADLDAAIAAVNEANIFRFLCKPCAPERLHAALEAAAEQYRLVTAERVLLQQTLGGTMKMLIDVLALSNPAAFGRASRAKQLASRMAAYLRVPDAWKVEVAAMLSQLGCITLPRETAERLYHGAELTFEERAMVDRLPAIAGKLLAHIPRLEPVHEIVLHQDHRFDGANAPPGVRGEKIPWGARVLKVVLDYDGLEAQGVSTELALQTLAGRTGAYDPALLTTLAALVGPSAAAVEVVEMSLRDVRPGTTFAEDVKTATGMLLIARGQEVTVALLDRLHNFSERLGVRDTVRMIVPSSGPARAGQPAHETAAVVP
jgi:response regulator RpfG family c-di-GMP phosphodiesterase